MHETRTYLLSDLLPSEILDGVGDYSLEVPDWAFLPDPWNFTLYKGLRQADLANQDVVEVGCGTGITLLLLHAYFQGIRLTYADIVAQCTRLAETNLRRNHSQNGHRALVGSWNLLRFQGRNGPPLTPQDAVVACIPQVAVSEAQLRSWGQWIPDWRAHYYDPADFPEASFNHRGLGLNEELLRQARSVLRRNGRAILNLAHRPGMDHIVAMFETHGFRDVRELSQRMIQQHADTSLRPFMALEDTGAPAFVFYEDEQGTHPISAHQAERRRLTGDPIFHLLSAFEAKLAS